MLELLIALILSKFVIVAVLSLAGAAYGESGSPGVTRLLTAMALVVLSTFAPWALIRLLPFTELAAGVEAFRDALPSAGQMHDRARVLADGPAATVERLVRRDTQNPREEEDGTSILSRASSARHGPSTGHRATGEMAAAEAAAQVASTDPTAEATPGESEAVHQDARGATAPEAATPTQATERLPGLGQAYQAKDFGWPDMALERDGDGGPAAYVPPEAGSLPAAEELEQPEELGHTTPPREDPL